MRYFYVLVLSLVDDFGRYEADPVRLRNEAYPLREAIRTDQVRMWLKEFDRYQLALFYKVDGKEYMALAQWEERARYPSRFPAPPDTARATALGCKMTLDAVRTPVAVPPKDNFSCLEDNFSSQQTSSPKPKPQKLSFAQALENELSKNGENWPWKAQLRRILQSDPDYGEAKNRAQWEAWLEAETDSMAKVLVKKYEANKADIKRPGAYLSKVAMEKGRWVKP